MTEQKKTTGQKKTAPKKRLRLMGLTVHPNLFIDDGQDADPIQTEPIQVRAADLDTFVADLRAQIAEEEAKLNEASEARS